MMKKKAEYEVKAASTDSGNERSVSSAFSVDDAEAPETTAQVSDGDTHPDTSSHETKEEGGEDELMGKLDSPESGPTTDSQPETERPSLNPHAHDSFRTLRRSTASVADLTRELACASVIDPSLLGSKQCSAMVVNYISAGYILLPFAFYQAGILWASIVFGLVTLQSYVTSLFILETCARAEAGNWTTSSGSLPRRYSMEIRETKYELTSLQNTFLGPRWTKFFLCTTACDLYSITWLLCSIFGQAVASQTSFAGVDDDYKLWVGVFMMITVPLSCTSILDQALLQFIFLGGRMVMVLCMIGTVIVALVHSDSNHFGDQIGPINDSPVADLGHTITIIQTAIFSTSFQFSVPAMAGASSNKKSMTAIFRHAVTFVYVSNCLLAILMAIYFGSATNPSSNLNWSTYHAGKNGWSKFVSEYVVLFAALDGLAIFPLICCSLGDILLAGVFGDKAPMVENNFKVRTLFRVIASLPQTVGALFVKDLGVLANYGGLFTIISYIGAPTLLYIASSRAMEESGLGKSTYYSNRWFSHNWLAYILLGTTTLIVIGVIVDSIVRST